MYPQLAGVNHGLKRVTGKGKGKEKGKGKGKGKKGKATGARVTAGRKRCMVDRTVSWLLWTVLEMVPQEGSMSVQIVDAVNWKANAVNLPCARSLSNASKLDAVLAKQYFTQCSVATRDVLSHSVVVNAWICARRTTHHDLVSVIPDEKRERTLKHEKEKICNCRNFMRTYRSWNE